MKTSVIIKCFISTFIAFQAMITYLFEEYSNMILNGRDLNYGIAESGMSDAFMTFLEAVFIGCIVWLACIYLMNFIGRLFNKRSSEKRRCKRRVKEEGDFRD